MSSVKTDMLGAVAGAANAVSSLLGGRFGGAARGAEQLQSLVAGPQHDAPTRRSPRHWRKRPGSR